MSATQHLDLPTQARRTVPATTNDDTIGFRLRAAGSSFFWAMQLLSHQRREAMSALYAFCREVDDIADGDAPRWLKRSWLSDWRNEIALLYAGRPRQAVTRALSAPVRLYRLPCHDFLAVIDGIEMGAQTDIRAPTIDLDLYCERVAVAVGRLSGADFRGGYAGGGARRRGTRPRAAADQHSARPRRGCRAKSALSSPRDIAGARHLRNYPELGTGAAGAP